MIRTKNKAYRKTEREKLKLQKDQENAMKIKKKLSAEERLEIQLLNKAEMESAKIKKGILGDYYNLNKQRTDAQKQLADLLAAEKQNAVQIAKTQKEFEELDKRIIAIDTVTKNHTKNIGNYRDALNSKIIMKENKNPKSYIGLGVAFGAVFGSITGNISLGVAMGLIIGVVVGILKKDKNSSQCP